MNTIENTLPENLLIMTPTHKTQTSQQQQQQRHQTRSYHNLNYDDINSIRGFAFESCKEYLGGVWKKIRASQFQIEKVS
jgi:hypothetical protein